MIVDELNVAIIVRYVPSTAYKELPTDDERDPYHDRYEPGHRDHYLSLLRSPIRSVRQRASHWQIPIEANNAQIHHGRVRRHVINRQPYIAEDAAKPPAILQEVQTVYGDGQSAYDDVRNGKTQNEVVVHHL